MNSERLLSSCSRDQNFPARLSGSHLPTQPRSISVDEKKKIAVGEIIYFSGMGLHPCLAWRPGSPLSGMAEEEGPGVIIEEREMGGYPGPSSIHL